MKVAFFNGITHDKETGIPLSQFKFEREIAVSNQEQNQSILDIDSENQSQPEEISGLLYRNQYYHPGEEREEIGQDCDDDARSAASHLTNQMRHQDS